MNNVLILYWEPGTGGDTVQKLFSMDPKFCTVVEDFQLEKSGRTSIKILPWFQDNFPHTPKAWYVRQWTLADLELMDSWPDWPADSTLILPTHRPDQARWLKTNIPNSSILGICYTKNLFQCVLSQRCKKIADFDVAISQHYTTPFFEKLRTHKVFGAYVLKDQLKFGSSLPQEVLPVWDYNLPFEQLLVGNISTLQQTGLDIDLVSDTLLSWCQQQKTLYRQQWQMNKGLRSALGFNCHAPLAQNLQLELDEYDRIFINHWLVQNRLPRSANKLSTLHQANDYFENLNTEVNYDKQ